MNFCEDRPTRREGSLFHNKLPILTIYNKSLDAQQLLLKRLLDIVGAIVCLIIMATLLTFVALAIKLDSQGPVFFTQERIGLNGRIFKCRKLRSMYADAEARKQELLHRNEMHDLQYIERWSLWLDKTILLKTCWVVCAGRGAS